MNAHVLTRSPVGWLWWAREYTNPTNSSVENSCVMTGRSDSRIPRKFDLFFCRINIFFFGTRHSNKSGGRNLRGIHYGQYMFHRNSAYNTRNINVASHHPTTASRDFFSNRVIKYWNQLQPPVKHASSVNAFKAGLDYFKFRKPNSPFGYWHLSEEIFTRIPDSREYKSFLMANRNIALRRNVLCWYVGGIFIFIGMGFFQDFSK